MNMTDPDAPHGAATEQARLDDIAGLYAGLRALLRAQVDAARTDTTISPKSLVTRLSDLQSAHLLLTKAEEKFHDAFGTDDPDAPDIDSIRAEIGRKLDRIRKANGAKDVP